MTNRFEKAIELHKRQSRIYFAEIRENETELVVAVRQTRSPNENYADKKRLEEIVRELYALKSGFKKALIVHTSPYSEAPSEIVSPEWIKIEMQRRKLGLKGIVEATGVSKSDLSAMINGHKEMGIRTKGLFYYFFKSLDISEEDRKDQIIELENEIERLKEEKAAIGKMLAKKISTVSNIKGRRLSNNQPADAKVAIAKNKKAAKH